MKPTTPGPKEWTPAEVYGPNRRVASPEHPIGLCWPPRIRPKNPRNELAGSGYTPEFFAAHEEETEWTLTYEPPELTPAQIFDITSRARCPICAEGKNFRRYKGMQTGIVVDQIVECDCDRHGRTRNLWMRLAPARYRHIRLDTLQPNATSKLPLEKQKEFISVFQKHREDSYFLQGDAGTGKTHFGMALLFDAVERWSLAASDPLLYDQSVWRINTRELLDDYWRYKIGEGELPYVNPKQLLWFADRGHKISLFLDEFDKFAPNKFRIDTLQEIVDAVYVGQGQVVSISNTCLAKLLKEWADFSSAPALLRRIAGEEANGRVLTFKAKR
jgi:hypothetical protein